MYDLNILTTFFTDPLTEKLRNIELKSFIFNGVHPDDLFGDFY